MPAPLMSTMTPDLSHKAPPLPGGGERRVRVAMYLAFVTLAVAMLVQGWNALRLEALRAADADITGRAALQGTFSQQIGRMAALIELSSSDLLQRTRNADALAVMLVQQGADALMLNELLDATGEFGRCAPRVCARRSRPGKRSGNGSGTAPS